MATIQKNSSASASAASAPASDVSALKQPTKKPRKASATKATPVAAATATATETKVEETKVGGAETAQDDVPVCERIATRVVSLVEKITTLESTFVAEVKDLKSELKALQKDFVRYQKAVASGMGKRKRVKSAPTTNADGTEAPKRTSGFQKPTGISDQLADFLNISRGTQLPRMDVTRRINEYIKEHDLQNPADRRKLIPNKALHAVLGTTPETEVSYFNYQGFLKGHFISLTPAPAPAAVVV